MFTEIKEPVCILFIMGRPGSGKSLTARSIKGQGELNGVFQSCLPAGWNVEHITDYALLMKMFQYEEQAGLDPSQRRFASSPQNGFVVKDFTVLREVLVEINAKMVQQMHDLTQPKLFLVEFARDDYGSRQDIWGAFADSVLENAYCLCLQADMPLCMNRVHKRANNRLWEDDTFVTYDVMTSYYHDERFIDVQELFGMTRVEVVDNNGAWLNAWAEISNFVHSMCVSREMFLRREPVPVRTRNIV